MVEPNYKSNGATELLNYAEHILKKVEENEGLFDEPVPLLRVLDSTLSAYCAAYAEATHRKYVPCNTQGTERGCPKKSFDYTTFRSRRQKGVFIYRKSVSFFLGRAHLAGPTSSVHSCFVQAVF